MLVRDFKNAGILYYKGDKLYSPDDDDVIERIEAGKYDLLVYVGENINNMSLIDIQERCSGECVDCSLIRQCPFTNFVSIAKPCNWKLN